MSNSIDYKEEERMLNHLLSGKKVKVVIGSEELQMLKGIKGYDYRHYRQYLHNTEGTLIRITRTNYRQDGYYQYVVAFEGNSIKEAPFAKEDLKLLDSATLL